MVHAACLYLYLLFLAVLPVVSIVEQDMAGEVFRCAVFLTALILLIVRLRAFVRFINVIFIFQDDNKLRFYINIYFVFISFVIFLLAKIVIFLPKFCGQMILFLL